VRAFLVWLPGIAGPKPPEKRTLPRSEGEHMIMCLGREPEEEVLLGLLWEFHAG